MTYLKPTFFIIGERKCGTSSLFRYLTDHPHVLPGRLKEPQFFSKYSPEYIAENIQTYWSFFPQKTDEEVVLTWPELDKQGILYEEKVFFKRENETSFITGDASANTFCEVDPALLYQYLPEVKLILLFRDPVQRAFSHHRMYLRFQAEGRRLEREIRDFETEMEYEMQAHLAGEKTIFIGPGLYINQLKKWRAIYPEKQFSIYFSEQLATGDAARNLLSDIQNYLNLPYYSYPTELEKRYNQAPPATMPVKTAQKLRSFYLPFNQHLSQYLSRKLPSSWYENI